MQKLLLSIVIPFYNVKEIDYTMHNLLNFQLDSESKDFEIIIVDDCSEIKFRKILNKYKKHAQIITHARNFGLSISRQTGLAACRGKYVFFLDAGDRLMINELIKSLKKNNGIDIITYNFLPGSSKKSKMVPKGNSFKNILQSYAGVWLRAYKISILKPTFFLKENWFAEDVYFTLNACQYAKSFYKDEQIIYIYNESNAGMTKQLSDSWLTIIQTMNKLIDGASNEKIRKMMVTRKLFQLLATLSRMRHKKNKKKIYDVFYCEIKQTKAFWHLKFKLKIYYIFVRTKIYWLMFKN